MAILPGIYGINYTEVFDGSPEEQIGIWDSQVTRKYMVAWNDREEFVEDLLGLPSVKNGQLSRRIPFGYPSFSSNGPWLYASRVLRTKGVGNRGKDQVVDVSNYEKCLITALHESRTYKVTPDQAGKIGGIQDEGTLLASGWANSRYVTKLPEPCERQLTLNLGMMRFVDDAAVNAQGQPIGGQAMLQGLPWVLQEQEIHYTWHEVPVEAYPNTAITTCMGQVNNATFDGYPARTLLCRAPKFKPYQTQLGQRLLDIHYTFRFRPNVDKDGVPQGWNAVPKVVGGQLTFVPVTSNGRTLLGSPPHRLVDFKTLFQPEP